MTREYPPEVYGGAGVHVTELVAQLRELCQVDVHCMGAPRPGAFTYQPDPQLRGANPALSTLSSDLVMANAAAEATVVHTHTWYTGLAGHLASLLYDVPHVLTAHSLEPLRPWKAEQLGGGYRISSWVEQTAVTAADAVIAVSSGMRDDVLRVYPTLDPGRVHVVRNGIDTEVWYPAEAAAGRVGAGRPRRRPRPAHGGIRRADHPAERRRPPAGGRTRVRPRRAVGAVRRSARHAGNRRRSGRRSRRAGPHAYRRVLGQGNAADREDTRNTIGCNRFSYAHRCTSRWASSISRRWPAALRWWPPTSAAYPRWSTTGSPVRWCTTTPTMRRLPGQPRQGGQRPDRRSGRAERYGKAGRQRCIAEFSWAHIAEQTLEIYRKVCT